MRFPKTIRHHKATGTIYAKTKNYAYYRIAYRAEGKRHLANFSKYSDALAEAKKKAKEISQGHAGVVLSAAQARDALNALQILDSHRQQGIRLPFVPTVELTPRFSKNMRASSARRSLRHWRSSLAVEDRPPAWRKIGEMYTHRARRDIAGRQLSLGRIPWGLAGLALGNTVLRPPQ